MMTLVVPSLDLHNIFKVMLMFALGNIKIGATKPLFLDYSSPREGREGGSCMCGRGLLSLYSSYTKFKKKTLFSLPLTVICAELCCQTT